MADYVWILVAVLLAFIAFKMFMGMIRIGVILLIVAVLFGMWQSGAMA